MAGIHLSPARSKELFANRGRLLDHLATQLNEGRLALVLGAGVSHGFNLPNWDVLVDRCLAQCGLVRTPGRTNEALSDDIFVHCCKNDHLALARLVHCALYETADLRVQTLRSNPLLAALGALATMSRKGAGARIVSFNYDDLLELFLRQNGIITRSVEAAPFWSSNDDISVLHPHGLLRSGETPEQVTSRVVFSRLSFDEDDWRENWEALFLDYLGASICLFVGLSGDDAHLCASLLRVHHRHAMRGAFVFWGTRFGTQESERELWENNFGVSQWTLADYADLPAFLFELCELAQQQLSE
jgi:hypothetical protein